MKVLVIMATVVLNQFEHCLRVVEKIIESTIIKIFKYIYIFVQVPWEDAHMCIPVKIQLSYKHQKSTDHWPTLTYFILSIYFVDLRGDTFIPNVPILYQHS